MYTHEISKPRIQEMLTRASKASAKNANAKNDSTEFFEMSSRGDMEPPLELDSASSSDGQVGISNHIHVEDYFC